MPRTKLGGYGTVKKVGRPKGSRNVVKRKTAYTTVSSKKVQLLQNVLGLQGMTDVEKINVVRAVVGGK